MNKIIQLEINGIAKIKRIVFVEIFRTTHINLVMLHKDLNGRMVDRDIEVVLTEAALKHIEVSSFSATFGARPLKRWIDRVRILVRFREIVFFPAQICVVCSTLRRNCRKCC